MNEVFFLFSLFCEGRFPNFVLSYCLLYSQMLVKCSFQHMTEKCINQIQSNYVLLFCFSVFIALSYLEFLQDSPSSLYHFYITSQWLVLWWNLAFRVHINWFLKNRVYSKSYFSLLQVVFMRSFMVDRVIIMKWKIMCMPVIAWENAGKLNFSHRNQWCTFHILRTTQSLISEKNFLISVSVENRTKVGYVLCCDVCGPFSFHLMQNYLAFD